MNAPAPALDTDLFDAIQMDLDGWKAMAFRRYRDSVARLVYRRLGRTDDTDDIVGDVFLRFFERAAHVRKAASLRAYVLSITRHVICEEIEKRTRQRSLFGSVEQDIDEAFSADDPAARAALRELERILDRLRNQDRRAYVLRKVVGLELERVAEALGTSQSTTQRSVARASEFVRKSAARSALLGEYAEGVRHGPARRGSAAHAALTTPRPHAGRAPPPPAS